MKSYKTVDEYIENSGDAQTSLELLREILLDTKLDEVVKWGIPVYALGKKNVVGIGAFKSYTGLWFYQGALLEDAEKKLVNAQEGVTKALRQWRFTSIEEIKQDQGIIRKYIDEAIKNQEMGLEIKPDKKKPLVIPDELKIAFEANKKLSEAFETLKLTYKREYAEYISEAKRETTKLKRLEKITPMILEGKGLNDKYR